MQWLEAEAGSLQLAKPPQETPAAPPQIRVPAAPPPEVVFSAPIADETDVALSANVRIQFSRDIDPATLRGRVAVCYASPDPANRDATVQPKVDFSTEYRPANRVLEIRFAQPLERFRVVEVQLDDGILGTDHQPLRPWKLTFTTGGS